MDRFSRTLLSIFLFLVSQSATGQDFVVNTKGDTLKGKVRLLQHDFEKRVQVQGLDKHKITLSIMQVKTVLVNAERFDPVKYNNQYIFMKLLKQGYLSLYAFQLEKQLSYDGRYMIKMDGKGMEVPNLVFKKNMSTFLEECEALSTSIEEGKLGRNDLTKIIDEFNACIDKNSIVSSTSPSVKIDPSITAAWNDLQTKVQASSIETKVDALEMISDIKAKLNRGEKLPKFLVEGLRGSFEGNPELAEALSKALATMQ